MPVFYNTVMSLSGTMHKYFIQVPEQCDSKGANERLAQLHMDFKSWRIKEKIADEYLGWQTRRTS